MFPVRLTFPLLVSPLLSWSFLVSPGLSSPGLSWSGLSSPLLVSSPGLVSLLPSAPVSAAFGFCEYREPESTLRALRLLHELLLGDKKLLVKVDAKTKAQLDEWKAKKKSANGVCSLLESLPLDLLFFTYNQPLNASQLGS